MEMRDHGEYEDNLNSENTTEDNFTDDNFNAEEVNRDEADLYPDALDTTIPDRIESLVSRLGSASGITREESRRALVEIGEAAVPALIRSLDAPNHYITWEAAKALAELRDPVAAPALVRNIAEAPLFEVRWASAEALIALGPLGLDPLLQALVTRPDSVWLREGAHHVLHVLSHSNLYELVGPVLTALEGLDPSDQVAPAAQAALDALRDTRTATHEALQESAIQMDPQMRRAFRRSRRKWFERRWGWY